MSRNKLIEFEPNTIKVEFTPDDKINEHEIKNMLDKIEKLEIKK